MRAELAIACARSLTFDPGVPLSADWVTGTGVGGTGVGHAHALRGLGNLGDTEFRPTGAVAGQNPPGLCKQPT
jgi:hypothetical protein